MDYNTIVDNASRMLQLSSEDITKLIQDSFSSTNPFGSLLDLFGYDNIDLVFEIFKNKELFVDKDFKNVQALFIEYVIPETISTKTDVELLKTEILEENSKYFSYPQFNPIQSTVFESVYKSDGNILISAPTGAGKTDIALLAVLRALQTRNSVIIYIVPMKALATEIFSKFRKLLKDYEVIEYTGDTDIDISTVTRARIVVCTPEKFDASTRRLSCVFKRIKLVVIDEIHLLEDDRGPVLEAIVARIFRNSEMEQYITRIMGLSATLPNYQDVAQFIKAQHVHFFDSSYRPVPLKMLITGFTKASDYHSECEYLVEKVQDFINKGKQVLVFVHSRLKTFKLASFLSDSLKVAPFKSTTKTSKIKGDMLRIVNKSVGIHHAGLPREDRLLMEELFRNGTLKVLVCTSTLAWGVNLPAYGVIISGSTFYNPSKGAFDDLGILDILQIFGRAGRPQYDSKGEAILITTANKIDMYVRLLKRNEDIESRMLLHVPENLNAEIYLGNVFSVSSALSWIRNTFLSVRMMKSPMLYGISSEEIGLEEQALSEYIYLTVKRLEDCGMIRIDRKETNYNTWGFSSTFYGQIASLYYLKHITMYNWLLEIQNVVDEVSLINLLLKSEEFKNVTVRKDEVSYLNNIYQDLLLDSIVDFEFDETTQSKLLILLISYLCYRKMPVFSLSCDLDYVVDNIKRLVSAFKDILLYIGKYDIFLIAFLLEKKLYRYKKTKGGQFQVSLIRIDDKFVELSLEVPTPGSSTVFVFNGKDIEYIFEMQGSCKCIFKYKYETMPIKIHTNRDWMIFETTVKIARDFSIAGLYRFGVHSCDACFSLVGNRQNCVHFVEMSSTTENVIPDKDITAHLEQSLKISSSESKQSILCDLDPMQSSETYNNLININFSLDIVFIEIFPSHFKERSRLITQQIFKVNLQSVLVVCIDMNDVRDTQQYLNTKIALEDLSLSNSYNIGKIPGKDTRRWVCTFEQAKSIRGFDNVIFKGISTAKSIFPVYEIFRIAHNRKAFIYENHRNAKFVRSLMNLSKRCVVAI